MEAAEVAFNSFYVSSSTVPPAEEGPPIPRHRGSSLYRSGQSATSLAVCDPREVYDTLDNRSRQALPRDDGTAGNFSQLLPVNASAKNFTRPKTLMIKQLFKRK